MMEVYGLNGGLSKQCTSVITFWVGFPSIEVIQPVGTSLTIVSVPANLHTSGKELSVILLINW
jgi:hypothetical protein